MKKIWPNILYYMIVSIMIVVSIGKILKTYEKKIITNGGIKVMAEVIESPNSCKNLGKKAPYSKLKYNDKIFIKKTGGDFCHLVSQKKYVYMYTNKDGNELIFINEYDPLEFLYSTLLLIIALVLGLKRIYSRKSKKA